MIDLELFFDISRDVAMATNFVAKLPNPLALIVLAFIVGINCHFWTTSVSGMPLDYLKVDWKEITIIDGRFFKIKI